MGRYKKNLGEIGEKYAVDYLQNKGYKILGRNVYIKGGEIDIIAQKDNLVIFIEVKTRKSDEYVDIVDSIDKEKEESLTASCEEYLAQNGNISDNDFRIDLIGIVINRDTIFKFEHIKGII